MKRIYIAGALTADVTQYIKNVSIMMEWAESIRLEGFAVYIPGVDVMMGIKFGYYERDDYFYNSLEWMKVSDAVFLVPGWENSKGVKEEIRIANKMGIPVYPDPKQLVREMG